LVLVHLVLFFLIIISPACLHDFLLAQVLAEALMYAVTECKGVGCCPAA